MELAKGTTTRRLAALMFTDMVGYSAIAREDEAIARELGDAQRAIIREALIQHHGREHQTTGDGFFLEFASAINAVQCAIEIQTRLHERERSLPQNRRLKIRIGIHLGDILTNDEDLYGNGVNVAARVEPLAKPGGICITRQIYDQVAERIPGAKFKKNGVKSIKNIRGGAEIFHVVLPWEDEARARKRRMWFPRTVAGFPATLNSVVIGAFFVACFASLILATAGALRSNLKTLNVSERSPAQSVASEPLDLSDGWSFRMAPSEPWERFETRASYRHADKLSGSYSMTKTFSSASTYNSPAIVLGLFSGSHRAYLNGKFIGGSDRAGELAYYPFAKELLNKDGENTLSIEGETRRALNPGLLVLPKVGAFLGEFESIQDKVRDNNLKFQFLRNMFFGLAALIFVASFGFALVRRSSMPYFYSSIIILLSTLNLAYYSSWISNSVDYPFLRFLKVISLTLVPLILVSAQLRLKRKTTLETANNLLALTSLVAIAGILFYGSDRPSDFIENYNMLLGAGAIYAIVSCFVMVGSFLKGLSIPRKRSFVVRSFQAAYFVLAIMSAVSVFCAIRTGPDLISKFVAETTTPQMRVTATEAGMTIPFLFSLFLVFIATADHLQQSRAAKLKRRRDELMLEIVHVMNSSRPFAEMIQSLQRELCTFLMVERSTLYVLDESGSSPELSADYFHSATAKRHDVKRKISMDEGVIGYVVKSRSPILIEDIRRDARFSGGHESYRSGSCMIFPLFSQGVLTGVLTFADKTAGAFDSQDFDMALELSSSLGLLLHNQQMRRALSEPKDVA